MIGRKGNFRAISPGAFNQLEVSHEFLPILLMNRKVLGYAVTNIVWLLYEEDEMLYKNPIAGNLYWWKALLSEPLYASWRSLKQIYVV